MMLTVVCAQAAGTGLSASSASSPESASYTGSGDSDAGSSVALSTAPAGGAVSSSDSDDSSSAGDISSAPDPQLTDLPDGVNVLVLRGGSQVVFFRSYSCIITNSFITAAQAREMLRRDTGIGAAYPAETAGYDNSGLTLRYCPGLDMYYFVTTADLPSGWASDPDGNEYYLDENGPVDGVTAIGGEKYVFSGCRLLKGINRTDEGIYVSDTSGRAVNGWYRDGGSVYYCIDGLAQTGIVTTDSGRYYLEDGCLQTGMFTSAGSSYIAGDDGLLSQGLTNFGEDIYYCDGGRILTGHFSVGEVTYTTDDSGKITKTLIRVPYISQQYVYPNGCEAVSAAMLLQFFGLDTDPGQFIDNDLDCEKVIFDNGTMYGPDPESAYAGDPRTANGWGCFPPALVSALNKTLVDTELTAYDLTGSSIDELHGQVISGLPLAVWVTTDMQAPQDYWVWYSYDGGTAYRYPHGEHCLVLAGFDSEYFFCCDPYDSRGLQKYDIDRFSAVYEAVGSRAAEIRPDD